jgi:hypothetical protein
MNMEELAEEKLAGETKLFGENLPQCAILSNTKFSIRLVGKYQVHEVRIL